MLVNSDELIQQLSSNRLFTSYDPTNSSYISVSLVMHFGSKLILSRLAKDCYLFDIV